MSTTFACCPAGPRIMNNSEFNADTTYISRIKYELDPLIGGRALDTRHNVTSECQHISSDKILHIGLQLKNLVLS